ncbi:MAG: hypothetical protein WD512_00735, partial [Candidatus Paceibacterota bacterium]
MIIFTSIKINYLNFLKMKIINYKHKIATLYFIGLFLSLSSCSEDSTQVVTTKSNLVMADEFDVDGAPNPENWTLDVGRGPLGDGWGNNELQFYTDRSENAIVQNGYLIITAKQESFSGASY